MRVQIYCKGAGITDSAPCCISNYNSTTLHDSIFVTLSPSIVTIQKKDRRNSSNSIQSIQAKMQAHTEHFFSFSTCLYFIVIHDETQILTSL